jgi:hypothetical protein
MRSRFLSGVNGIWKHLSCRTATRAFPADLSKYALPQKIPLGGRRTLPEKGRKPGAKPYKTSRFMGISDGARKKGKIDAKNLCTSGIWGIYNHYRG